MGDAWPRDARKSTAGEARLCITHVTYSTYLQQMRSASAAICCSKDTPNVGRVPVDRVQTNCQRVFVCVPRGPCMPHAGLPACVSTKPPRVFYTSRTVPALHQTAMALSVPSGERALHAAISRVACFNHHTPGLGLDRSFTGDGIGIMGIICHGLVPATNLDLAAPPRHAPWKHKAHATNLFVRTAHTHIHVTQCTNTMHM